MSVHYYKELLAHHGHTVAVVTYGGPAKPANVAIECEDCSVVLLDFDRPQGGRKTAKDKRIAAVEEARGQWDFEDKDYTREDWKYEVGNGDTQAGYFDWAINKLESAE